MNDFLGYGAEMIELVAHDPAWADAHSSAANEIRAALGATAVDVEHVGSTAIAGIIAKPRIDMLVLVERYDPEAAYREPLVSPRYAYDHRDELQVLFKGSREGTPVNLHVEEEGSADSIRMIVFRDYLRSHPDEARRYEHLKTDLAQRYSDDDAYAEGKSSYVQEVVRRARS
jgi:GrpB-like predicted nucleotidyltransferase (UPF0157 family)